MRGKYAPLYNHLARLQGHRWQASFSEIERILAAPLPPSARTYPAWWANEKTHVQSESWLGAGWETEGLNLTGEAITFRRARTLNP